MPPEGQRPIHPQPPVAQVYGSSFRNSRSKSVTLYDIDTYAFTPRGKKFVIILIRDLVGRYALLEGLCLEGMGKKVTTHFAYVCQSLCLWSCAQDNTARVDSTTCGWTSRQLGRRIFISRVKQLRMGVERVFRFAPHLGVGLGRREGSLFGLTSRSRRAANPRKLLWRHRRNTQSEAVVGVPSAELERNLR